MIPEQYALLPDLNATRKGKGALPSVAARTIIRRRRFAAHPAGVIAVTASALFLCRYLHFDLRVAKVHILGQGWAPTADFSILISPALLAVVIVPLLIMTRSPGLRARDDRHRVIARCTRPLWV